MNVVYACGEDGCSVLEGVRSKIQMKGQSQMNLSRSIVCVAWWFV